MLLFIGNAEFTKLLEYDYLTADGDDLSQLLSFQLSQIKEISSVLKEDLSQSNANFKYGVLLMQAGHCRDVILRLRQLHIRDERNFEWQKEVRSYYNGNEIAMTKYFTKCVEYGS